MKDLALYLTGLLIDNSEELTASQETVDHDTLKITISIPKAEMGKVIGKNGRIIHSLRSLLAAASQKQNLRIYLSLLEK